MFSHLEVKVVDNYRSNKKIRKNMSWFKKKSNNSDNPAGNYMFKVSNRNTRTRYEVCSKLTIKTPERRQWHRSGVFILNFEHILTLSM